VHHAVGPSADQHNAERRASQILLVGHPAVHRDQGVVPASGAAQQVAVLEALPAQADNRVDRVAGQLNG
jgi:hypothetical protein